MHSHPPPVGGAHGDAERGADAAPHVLVHHLQAGAVRRHRLLREHLQTGTVREELEDTWGFPNLFGIGIVLARLHEKHSSLTNGKLQWRAKTAGRTSRVLAWNGDAWAFSSWTDNFMP